MYDITFLTANMSIEGHSEMIAMMSLIRTDEAPASDEVNAANETAKMLGQLPLAQNCPFRSITHGKRFCVATITVSNDIISVYRPI